MRRIFFYFILPVSGAILLAVTVFLLTADKDIPEGVSGPQADDLKNRIENSVGMDAWKRFAAVEYTFPGHRHFYDIRRNFGEVEFQENGENTVVQFTESGPGLIFQKGSLVRPDNAADILDYARKLHEFEFFWLNPFASLGDHGAAIRMAGQRALLFSFPHREENYLIVTDRDSYPSYIAVWRSDFPVKGLEMSFEKWTTIKGAHISLLRRSFMKDIEISDVRAYLVYPEKGMQDRFIKLADEVKRSGAN